MSNLLPKKVKKEFRQKYEKNAKKLSKNFKDRPIILIGILLLIQILVVMAIFIWFKDKLLNFSAPFMALLTIFMTVHIVDKDMNPAYKISWLIPIAVFPIFGSLLYLFLHTIPGNKITIENLKLNIKRTRPYLKQNEKVLKEMEEEKESFKDLAQYLYNLGPYPIYNNSPVEYYSDGKYAFDEIFSELRKAKDFIYSEYFILKSGEILDQYISILKEKAREGVEVRFMFDAITMFNLPKDFEEDLIEAGIDVKVFSPVAPILSTYQNNRDHRKVLVIDNKVAFTGGINFADEYANLVNYYGNWKDNAIKIKGPAVKTMTAIFLQMWNIFKDGNKDYEKRLQEDQFKEIYSKDYLIPYSDAPGDGESLAKNVYLYMVYSAKKYIYIMSPYLVLDNEMIVALTFAAKRGLDVKIIIPHIPDKKIPFAVAKSHFKDLLPEGVKIYEYRPGFIHSKVMIVDGKAATVGTVNMDFRSFHLNYENGIFICGEESVFEIEEDFRNTILISKEVSIEDYKALPIYYRLFGAFMKIFGPLM